MSKITIRVKHFFDGVYMYVGVLLCMLGLIFILFDAILASIFIFLSLLVFTTVYKLSIYKNEKKYRNYLWVLGLKKGNKQSFNQINHLLITKNRYKRRFKSRGSISVIEYDLYRGYIVFNEDDKVLVGESKKTAKIEKQIVKLRDQLNLKVFDAR